MVEYHEEWIGGNPIQPEFGEDQPEKGWIDSRQALWKYDLVSIILFIYFPSKLLHHWDEKGPRKKNKAEQTGWT